MDDNGMDKQLSEELSKSDKRFNYYYTKDLGEAAALMSKSLKLLGLKKEGTYFLFVFEDRTQCLPISDEFWYGDLQVNARSYAEAMRRLKDRLFAR
jgi:hypothetical protein